MASKMTDAEKKALRQVRTDNDNDIVAEMRLTMSDMSEEELNAEIAEAETRIDDIAVTAYANRMRMRALKKELASRKPAKAKAPTRKRMNADEVREYAARLLNIAAQRKLS